MNFPQKKYNIIYADPPWKYKRGGKNGRGAAESHYNVMDIEEIKALPVKEIAADNCYLFLWATNPLLPEAIDVLSSWGFSYTTVAFTWVKTNSKNPGSVFWGMGCHTRANAEPLLLGKKGRLERVSNNIHSVILGPISEHSRKPDTARKRIIQLLGDLPRIELFARSRVDGWDTWGEEA